MSGVRRLVLAGACALLAVACGSDGDGTVRDANGNVIEGGDISVFSLNVGDCFVDLPIGEVSTVAAVPCADDHRYEIYHEFDIDLADFDLAAVQAAATDGCLGAFEPYMGVSYEQSYYDFDGLQPSAGSWEQDDREVICLATPKNGEATKGTARGAALLAQGSDEQSLAETTTTTAAATSESTAAESTSTTEEIGGSQSVFELAVGECYVQLPGSDLIESVEAISCDLPHGIEIYHLFDVTLDEFDAEMVQMQAEDGCFGAFEAYTGISYAESWYGFDGLLPTAQTWADGDREVVCFLQPYDEGITDSVGSARGTARTLDS